MSKMTAEQEKGIFKAAVVVHDEAGLPNFMTMFYFCLLYTSDAADD